MFRMFAVASGAMVALIAAPALADNLHGKAVDPLTPPMKDRLRRSAELRLNFGPQSNFLLGVVEKCAAWETSQALKACFVHDDTRWRDDFVKASTTWLSHRPQLLDFGEAPSYRTCAGDKKEAIRIAFREKAGAKQASHWGCVGRNSVRPFTECGESDASLNVNPALVGNDPARFRIAVLHEMGHALGFQHEHQHPAAKCWDQIDHEVAFAEYSDLMTPAEVEAMFKALIGDAFDFRPYDQKSIMHYSIPKNLFRTDVEATCQVPQNEKLSGDDEKIVKEYYPPIGGTPRDCVDISSRLFMSLGPTREQKLAFGEEIVRTLSAGATDKRTVTFKLDDGLGVRPFAKQAEGQPPPASLDHDGDCAPASLKGKASCNLSADGTALWITIK